MYNLPEVMFRKACHISMLSGFCVNEQKRGNAYDSISVNFILKMCLQNNSDCAMMCESIFSIKVYQVYLFS